MNSRNIARRLERLKHAAVLPGVRRVWRIVIYDKDGSRRDEETIEWPRAGPGPTLSERPRHQVQPTGLGR